MFSVFTMSCCVLAPLYLTVSCFLFQNYTFSSPNFCRSDPVIERTRYVTFQFCRFQRVFRFRWLIFFFCFCRLCRRNWNSTRCVSRAIALLSVVWFGCRTHVFKFFYSFFEILVKTTAHSCRIALQCWLLTVETSCHCLQLVPKRIDWQGQEHDRSFENLVSALLTREKKI